MKIIQPQGNGGSRSGSRTCEAAGCANNTRENKPFCPDHVQENPYVKEILDTLAAREEEEARVKRAGVKAVELSGLTAHELLLHLRLHGARTVERLARELSLEQEVVRNYVTALAKKGKVSIGSTRRGNTMVHPAQE